MLKSSSITRSLRHVIIRGPVLFTHKRVCYVRGTWCSNLSYFLSRRSPALLKVGIGSSHVNMELGDR